MRILQPVFVSCVIFFLQYKLCRVRKMGVGPKGVPFLVTNDGRTIRYPDPLVKPNDTIQLDIATSKILDFIKFEVGNLCMITGGHNLGRVGVVTSRERHPGSFDIVHIKDAAGHVFATRYKLLKHLPIVIDNVIFLL